MLLRCCCCCFAVAAAAARPTRSKVGVCLLFIHQIALVIFVLLLNSSKCTTHKQQQLRPGRQAPAPAQQAKPADSAGSAATCLGSVWHHAAVLHCQRSLLPVKLQTVHSAVSSSRTIHWLCIYCWQWLCTYALRDRPIPPVILLSASL